MQNQCIGLAEALGTRWQLLRVQPRAPWRFLPSALWWPRFLASGTEQVLRPPWPDVLISCGRRSVAAALGVRRAARGQSFVIHVQHPHVHPRHFDLVVVPAHDRLDGPNVVVTRGALHRVTQARLREAASALAPALAHLPRPLVAVLVGGSNRSQNVSREVIEELCARLVNLSRRHGAALAVTPSRRTGGDNERLLRERLRAVPSTVWDGSGENPYFGYLGLADAVVVTADSVSMVSEACATGKPVYVYELEGGGRRLRRFHRGLREAGLTRPFRGTLEDWRYTPTDDVQRAARIAGERLAQFRALRS